MKQPVDYVLAPIRPGQRVPYHRLVLRGCSQLCFQSNELTGLCLLVAVALVDPLAAAYFLFAAVIAPAARRLLGQRGPALAAGLAGLNPCLTAVALATFFETRWTDVAMWLVLLGCVVATVLLVHVLVAVAPFPVLALPFLVVVWTVYLLAPHTPVLTRAPAVAGPADFHLVVGVLSSLGEVVFAPSTWSGLLVLAGLLLSNWRHAAVAVLGAAIGTSVSFYYHSADPAAADLGLFGFNGVLTAIAVYVLCGASLRLSILGALIATIMLPVIATLGVPPVSAPLVLSVWLLLALGWADEHWFAPPTSTEENSDAPNR